MSTFPKCTQYYKIVFLYLTATELLEFGGLSEESLYDGEFKSGMDKTEVYNNHVGSNGIEKLSSEEDLSFTPAGSQFGEIGERIRSAKAGSRVKHQPANSEILPLNNHI